jgi:hydrogenase maturation protease
MTRVLIGGVGYRWQGDASFGLVASDALMRESWPDTVDVADLGYGALYVTQDLSDAHPPYTRLVLLAAVSRGRTPGAVYRREWQPPLATPAEIQERVREAGAGVIDLDHLLVIASYFGALPADVVTLEFEPIELAGADLSPAAAALLPEMLALARSEALAPAREAIGA